MSSRSTWASKLRQLCQICTRHLGRHSATLHSVAHWRIANRKHCISELDKIQEKLNLEVVGCKTSSTGLLKQLSGHRDAQSTNMLCCQRVLPEWREFKLVLSTRHSPKAEAIASSFTLVLGWGPSHAIASRLEAIATRLEASASSCH